MMSGRKSTLTAQHETFKRNHLRSLLNPTNNFLLIFQFSSLRSNQPKTNSLIGSQIFQRLKSPSSFCIKLQKVTINLNISKKCFCNSLISAIPKPPPSVIPTTRVHGNSHLFTFRDINAVINELHIFLKETVKSVSSALYLFFPSRVAHQCQGSFVELYVSTTSVVQSFDFFAIGGSQVFEKG